MIALGIAVGVFVSLFMGAIIGLHVVGKADAGVFPGIVAGIWAAWPIIHQGRLARNSFLHPVPRRYKKGIKQAFSKVREVLSEKTYNYGDKWHVDADTQKGRVVASLRYTDEELKIEGGGRGNFHTKKERLKRLIELEVQMKEVDGETIVQLDFFPKVEGASYAACDSIITRLKSDLEQALGAGVDAGDSLDKTKPAPPWWLLALTALAVLLYTLML